MRFAKLLAFLLIGYVGLVFLVETLIGYFQPGGETTLVITTTDADGTSSDRVLSRLELDGQLYVAVNHWPRAWYRAALANPEVEVALDGPPAAYLAVPVTDAERTRLATERPLSLLVRFLTGFPPRHFLRLDPR